MSDTDSRKQDVFDAEGDKLRKQAREFFIHGGGGHEDGEDGARASTFTFEGMVDMAVAFAEYLIEGKDAISRIEREAGRQEAYAAVERHVIGTELLPEGFHTRTVLDSHRNLSHFRAAFESRSAGRAGKIGALLREKIASALKISDLLSPMDDLEAEVIADVVVTMMESPVPAAFSGPSDEEYFALAVLRQQRRALAALASANKETKP